MNKKRMERLQVLTQTDMPLWEQGILFAGMDEAGRGPLCGNVVTACVIMPKEPLLEWVDDSKKLSPKRREEMYDRIMEEALYVGIGQADPEEIDRVNILEATKNAMRRAAENCPASLYLIDALQGLGLNGEERGIIHGDAVCYSIAAASIIAKSLSASPTQTRCFLPRRAFSASAALPLETPLVWISKIRAQARNSSSRSP